ncbi:MAG TPA: transposase [Pirellulales bacterium]|nr:transposase [Pirellulales bacterium]
MGGYAYHVLNRANGRLRLFRKDADFAAFDQIVEAAHEHVPLRILGYVVMGNHWHFVVWPRRDRGQEVSEFFRWLTVTHAQRWRAHHNTSGMGHVYQGRFKSFPVAADEHLLGVLRYVERNPLRAGLVRRAEKWRWGSLHRRVSGTEAERNLLAEPPAPLGDDWIRHVNAPQSKAELDAIRRAVNRGQPFGGERWTAKVTGQLGLAHTFRPRGRPKKQIAGVPSEPRKK